METVCDGRRWACRELRPQGGIKRETAPIADDLQNLEVQIVVAVASSKWTWLYLVRTVRTPICRLVQGMIPVRGLAIGTKRKLCSNFSYLDTGMTQQWAKFDFMMVRYYTRSVNGYFVAPYTMYILLCLFVYGFDQYAAILHHLRKTIPNFTPRMIPVSILAACIGPVGPASGQCSFVTEKVYFRSSRSLCHSGLSTMADVFFHSSMFFCCGQ